MTKEEFKALKESGKELTYCEIDLGIIEELNLQGNVTFECGKTQLEMTKLLFLNTKRIHEHLMVVKDETSTRVITDCDLFKFPNFAGMMFSFCRATSLDLSNFDTFNVTNMNGMFEHCEATSLDLSNFDTSNVTSMNSMFRECKATELDLSNFDTSNVTDMEYIFYFCQATIIGKEKFI